MKYLNDLNKKFLELDSIRESLIRKSRDVVKSSKEVIGLVHRDKFLEAETSINNMKKLLGELHSLANDNPKFSFSGSVKIAEQEFVEAITLFEFLSTKKISTGEELGVNEEYYLMGLCDLCGELTRKAVNSVIAENYSLVLEIKDFITQLHEDLELFSLSGELRKKFDSIKYHLSKLEDIVLRLKLSDKI